ncbi:MAG TPA: hypothetical protein VLM85_28985 [Polyangiaceae bacterium]|nr:hypothetical protein [Polyangiaceae bacterium]
MARRARWVAGGTVLFVLGCPAATARHVEIGPAPVAAAPPIGAAPLPPSSVPDGAVPIHSEAKGSWARAFPAAKGFREVVAASTSTLVLVWRVGPQHKAKQLDPSEDYPANYVQPVDLLVGDGAGRVSIALGELAGAIERPGVTYCRGRGFRPPHPVPSWQFPSEPSVAAAFSIGVVQGDSELLLVRDADVLHLLRRETSDGRCDEIKQGPLDGCEGFEYERVADVRIPRGAALYELVEDEAKPLDCSVPPFYGVALLPPR